MPARNIYLTAEANEILDGLPATKGAISEFVSRAIVDAARIRIYDPRVLDGEAAAIAQRAGGAPYLAAVLAQRAEALAAALDVLRSRGWRMSELAAIAHVTMGVIAPAGRPLTWLAAEMRDAPHVAEDHGIAPERWAELIARVADDEPEARALYAVAAEVWAGNAEVGRWLGRPGGVSSKGDPAT